MLITNWPDQTRIIPSTGCDTSFSATNNLSCPFLSIKRDINSCPSLCTVLSALCKDCRTLRLLNFSRYVIFIDGWLMIDLQVGSRKSFLNLSFFPFYSPLVSLYRAYFVLYSCLFLPWTVFYNQFSFCCTFPFMCICIFFHLLLFWLLLLSRTLGSLFLLWKVFYNQFGIRYSSLFLYVITILYFVVINKFPKTYHTLRFQFLYLCFFVWIVPEFSTILSFQNMHVKFFSPNFCFFLRYLNSFYLNFNQT